MLHHLRPLPSFPPPSAFKPVSASDLLLWQRCCCSSGPKPSSEKTDGALPTEQTQREAGPSSPSSTADRENRASAQRPKEQQQRQSTLQGLTDAFASRGFEEQQSQGLKQGGSKDQAHKDTRSSPLSSHVYTRLQNFSANLSTVSDQAQTQAQATLAAMKQRARDQLRERGHIPSITNRVLSRLQGLSATVNQLTGYTNVERLKNSVAKADEELARLKREMDYRKEAYESLINKQLNLQRDLNSLLQKKSSWVDQDVSRFTELCRIEHKMDADVAAARDAHEKTADEVDAAQSHLFKAIRERYTEEQLWGDKIRRTATWWTWGLTGLQMLSFMGIIFVVEPRRLRLMQGHMQDTMAQHEASMSQHLEEQLDSHFAQVRQAVHDSREVNVVLHSLEEMQQMGMMDGGSSNIIKDSVSSNYDNDSSGVQGEGSSENGLVNGGHQQVQHVRLAQGTGSAGVSQRSRVGDEKGEETAKVLSAVVTFMDGLHTELSVMRGQLGRLEAVLMRGLQQSAEPGVQGAPVFASDFGAVAPHADQAEAVTEAGSIPSEGAESLESTQQHIGKRRRAVWGSGLSAEQAAGVAAAVGSGVGAVCGVLLMAYFSSRS